MIVRWNQLPFKVTFGTLTLFGALAYLLLQVLQPPTFAIDDDQAEMFPVPTVEILTVDFKPLRIWTSYSGRLTATEQAAVRPLVGGTIQQVLFEDGANVEAGQLLFVIDPRPFEAAVQRARAELASAQSAVYLAQVEFDRAEGLVDRNAISRSILDHRRNDLNNAQARVDAAKAELLNAELDLDHAFIKAPFAGRVGRAEVTVGNVIDAGVNAPVLTRIVSMNQLYAEFDVDETRYLELLRGQQAAQRMQDQNPEKFSALSDIPVTISMNASGDPHPVYSGRLYAFDNQLDTLSGTIRARALIENPDQIFLPGMFAEINMGSVSTEPTLLVPERAISPNQDRRYVYVVTDDNRTEYRELKLGRTVDGHRVVLDGLKAGERIVVNGLHRLRNDMPVLAYQP